MKTYQLSYAVEARNDLYHRNDYLVQNDAALAVHALDTIDSAINAIRKHPYICRIAADGMLGRYWRELIINFGSSGYLLIFEISDEDALIIVAVKHLRESDYH